MKNVVIYGAGGFGREVLNLINVCNQSEPLYNPLGFIVDPQFGTPGTIINDIPILGGFDWLENHHADVFVVVAVGEPHLRYRVVNRMAPLRCKYVNLYNSFTSISLNKWVTLGEDVVLLGCQLSCQTSIGNHVFINAYSGIGHDVTVGDFCTLGPGVIVDGGATIGTGCYIGTGTNILPNVTVGEWSVIGAGSIISKNIPANSMAMSATPRILKQMEPGWHETAS